MNQVRATLILSYSTVVIVCLGMAGGILDRSTDPTWADALRDVRWKYDVFAAAVIGLALLAAVGLFLRREWGRILSISLSLIVLFLYLGVPLYASISTRLSLGTLLGVESFVVSSLVLLNAIALSHRRFRSAYVLRGPTRIALK